MRPGDSGNGPIAAPAISTAPSDSNSAPVRLRSVTQPVVAHPVSDLGLAANYTWLHRGVSDPVRPDFRPTDTPRHSAFLRLDWQAGESLTVSPSVEVYSSRLSESAVQTGGDLDIDYTRMAGFALANLDFDWQATDRASVVFGVRNLLDRNYQLVEGFPEPGRSFYLTTRMTF